MLLPFLLCVLVLYVPLPVEQAAGSPLMLVVGVGALAFLNIAAGWLGSGMALWLTLGAGRKGRTAAARIFALLKGLVIGFVLADVFIFKWPVVVLSWLAPYRWAVLVGDVLLLLPALVMVLTVMAWQHRYEWRLGEVRIGLARYLWLRFRLELGIILLPWLLLVLATDLTTALFQGSDYARLAEGLATGGVLLGLVVFSPALLRRIWSSSPMPDGPLRRRLERLTERFSFRCDDILVWHTDNHLANAGVIGPTRLLRYVMISDALLRNCSEEEVAAIFAHEAGHVRLHHLPFYTVVALAFVAFYANGIDLLAMAGLLEPLGDILAFDMTLSQAVAMLIFAFVYWIPFFGFVSRRMEQESDLFALGAVEEPRAFLTALEKLGMLSTSPRSSGHWRHFSIERRIRFLSEVLEHPSKGEKFLRRTIALKAGIVVLFAAATARLALQRPELFGL